MVRVSVKLSYIAPTFEEIVKLDDIGLNGGQESVLYHNVTRTQV